MSNFERILSDLESEEAAVRRAAVWDLAELDDPRSVEILTLHLTDASPAVRQAAVYALGDLKDKRATLLIAELLDDTEAEVREASAWALGELRAQECITDLRRSLRDSDPRVRRSALKAITGMTEDNTSRVLLSRDLDGAGFWLDPVDPIDDYRVVEAMEALDITESEIRERYEVLGFRYGIVITWKQPKNSETQAESV